MNRADLQVVADTVFRHCVEIGHNMGCVHFRPLPDNEIFINIQVFDQHQRAYARQKTLKGIVDDTTKLIECGVLISEMLLADLSTKH